jgi:hypothetical protein
MAASYECRAAIAAAGSSMIESSSRLTARHTLSPDSPASRALKRRRVRRAMSCGPYPYSRWKSASIAHQWRRIASS